MNDRWIQIYETSKLHRAVMVQSVLKEHNIEAVILNQQDSSYVALGEIKVYVALEKASDAILIIDNEIS